MENPAPCVRAGLGEGVFGVYGKSGLTRQRELKTGTQSALDHRTIAGTGTGPYLRKPAPDVATHIPGGNNPFDVATTGVAACGLASSISGLCRGEGRISPSDIDARLLRLMEPMPLRREYLWSPHLSKRDLYARVLYDTISDVDTTMISAGAVFLLPSAPASGGYGKESSHIRRPKPIFLRHETLNLMERLVLVLVFGSDDLTVLVPLFCHGVRVQTRGWRWRETCTAWRLTQGLSSCTATMVRLLKSGIDDK
jgi:hypothetical protein